MLISVILMFCQPRTSVAQLLKAIGKILAISASSGTAASAAISGYAAPSLIARR